MMKLAIALCLIFAVSQAAHTTNWYSGSLNATNTPQAAVAVDTSIADTCTPLATVTGYRNFTVNITSTGFFYFTALFEKAFRGTAQLQVYSGAFTPSTPCVNLIYARSGNGYVPHIEFVQYLTPGLYPVVVTGTAPLSLGLFAIHVDATTLNGASNSVTGNWWYAPNPQSDGSCYSSSYPAPYTTFQFSQNGTTSADLLFFGYNYTVTGSWDFSVGLYNTSVANLAFVGTGNQTNPASGCNTANWVYGVSTDESDLTFHLQNNYTYDATAMLGVTLTNGLNYSVVIGTYDSYVFSANFGVFIRTTFLGALGTVADFVSPDVPGLGTTTECDPESARYYGVNWFTAIYNAYILDNPSSGFFDTAGCLYRGLNIGNATNPPANCPGNTSHIAFIQCGDTGDGGPVANFLIPGVNYTWIQFPYGGTGTSGAQYLLYNYSGKLLGNAPVTTTAPATTGSEMSSSSASSVVVMLALYIAAMFF